MNVKKLMLIPLMGLIINSGLLSVNADSNSIPGTVDPVLTETNNMAPYKIYPNPQEVEYGDSNFLMQKYVNVYFEDGIDVYTKNKLFDVLSLKDIKAKKVNTINSNGVSINIGIYNSNGLVDQQCSNKNLDYIANKIDAYYLEINSNSITILGKDTDACFYGMASLEMIFEQTQNTIKQLSIRDYSDSKFRGFIEGYYGIPWTSDERIELMKFGSKVKSNMYIYAPKNDSYHSSEWRKLYNEKDFKILKEQIKAGLETKTKFVWAIHPFMDTPITESNYTQGLTDVINKFEQIYDAGVRQFVISADDISIPDGTMLDGSLHRRLLNDVVKWNKDKGDCDDLIFVPTAYWYKGSTEKLNVENYLRSLVDGLDESVNIMWTGDRVCSSVANGRFEEFTNITGRKAFMWLNWPVNDYATSHLMMGKGEVLNKSYVDEEVEFSGIVTNPMPEAEPSKVSIFAVCDYTWNTKAFDANQSYVDSFKYIEPNTPESLYEICQHLSNASMFENHYFEEATELKKLINNYNYDLENDGNVTKRINALIGYFDKLIDECDNFLKNGANKSLIKSMTAWVLAIKDMANASKLYLDITMNIDVYSDSVLRDALNAAEESYTSMTNHKAPVLNAITYNIDMQNVDVAEAVMGPFLEKVRNAIRDDVLLKLGEPTGIRYEGFAGIYEGTLDNMVDGDDSTYCWFEGRPENNATIRIDLGKIEKITDIRVLFGNPTGGDYMKGILEVSVDAKTYIEVGSLNGIENVIDLRDTPINARFLLLRNTNTGTWVSIKEVSINTIDPNAPVVSYQGLDYVSSYAANGLNNMLDKDMNTYTWFDWRAEPGSFVQIDYRNVIEINNVVFYQNHSEHAGDYFRDCSFYYSLDGVSWKLIGNDNYLGVTDIVIDLSSNPIKARYIKVQTNIRTDYGVTIKEFGVNYDI